MAEQVVSIFAGTQGLLDDVAVKDVSRFEAGLQKHLRDQHGDILEQIASTGDLPNELAEKIKQVVRDYKTQFK